MSRHVVVVTHVPPFRESAWHEGRPGDDDRVPWFACKATGEAIMACARDCPRTNFIVLCGHTHGAEYGAPGVQRLFEFTP